MLDYVDSTQKFPVVVALLITRKMSELHISEVSDILGWRMMFGRRERGRGRQRTIVVARSSPMEVDGCLAACDERLGRD